MTDPKGHKTTELNIMVAGAAGRGLQTIGFILGKIFVRGGCEVFAQQEIESRIRGGHNWFHLKISHEPVQTASTPLDILIALDRRSVEQHQGETAENGLILFDSGGEALSEQDARYFGAPLEELAEAKGGRKLFSNSVAVGVVLALLGWEFERLEDFLNENYAAKPEMAQGNINAARAGYDFALEHAADYHGPKIPSRQAEPKMLITGHEALAVGALAAGCRFMSAYPMSPATSIMMYLAGQADKFGLVVEQAEDEIAAANMAIGASWAGVRSLTASSGGGFSLMVEALGLAGITETPLVVVLAQRPGPSTGMATKTQQPDLLFALNAGQDEFPRAILTPGSAGEAYRAAIEAFELAEEYQTPVIIMTDHFLANSYYTEDRFEWNQTLNRHVLGPDQAQGLTEYKRYRITDSGVSPRALPGRFPFVVGSDSHEHDEFSHITEDETMRVAQMDKRFRKLDGLAGRVEPPEILGDPKAELALAAWGSTRGALAEAVKTLNSEGLPVKGIHFKQLWPFPAEEFLAALEGVKTWLAVEGNFTGQLARLIRMETLKKPDGLIRQYTGRPFDGAEIAAAFRKEIQG